MNVRDLIVVLRGKERKDVKLTYLEIKSHEIEPSQDYVNNIRCKMCGLVHLSISSKCIHSIKRSFWQSELLFIPVPSIHQVNINM